MAYYWQKQTCEGFSLNECNAQPQLSVRTTNTQPQYQLSDDVDINHSQKQQKQLHMELLMQNDNKL